MKKLNRDFYNRDSIIVAKELLGKILIHEVDGQKIMAKIVETEAYMGLEDKAAHSYNGKRTPRTEIMYGDAGFAYVFSIYGVHSCFNVITREKDVPQAVLFRAVEPVGELDLMAHARFEKPYNELTKSQVAMLTNGPGKLCRALSIDRSDNGIDICGEDIYIVNSTDSDFTVKSTTRIGIDYAEEAKDFPWRFYIENNPYVSVKPKTTTKK